MIEDQGFLRHLEFLNPPYALPSRHYITLIPIQRAGMHTSFVGLVQQSM